LRTNAVVVPALVILVLTFFFLGAGNYGAHITLIPGAAALASRRRACAFYLALAELCEASYGRTVLAV
jgi:succinate-acetate transporter protein